MFKRKNKDQANQILINNILIAAVIVLIAYCAALTYHMLANETARESTDMSLAEQIFDLKTGQTKQTEDHNVESN